MFAREPRLPLDLFLNSDEQEEEETCIDWVSEHRERLKVAHEKLLRDCNLKLQSER